MSTLHHMPAEDKNLQALPIVAVAVTAVMAFALFGLPYLAAGVDTSTSLNSTTPVTGPAITNEQVDCQRVGDILCIYLEDQWDKGNFGSGYANWYYEFASNSTEVLNAGLYMQDLAPIVSTKEALDWWIGQCAGYKCTDFEPVATATTTETVTLSDGTKAIALFTGYTVNSDESPDLIQFGQSVALLPTTQNASVVILDLTFNASIEKLSNLTDVELDYFYADIEEYFWTLIKERLAVRGS